MKNAMKQSPNLPTISAAIAKNIDKLMPEIALTQKVNTEFLKSVSVAASKLGSELEVSQVSFKLPPPPPPTVMLDRVIKILPKIAAQQKAIAAFSRDIAKAAKRHEAELLKVKAKISGAG
jgi:hypothetical protein